MADTSGAVWFIIATHSYLLITDFSELGVLSDGYYYGTCVLPDTSVVTAKRLQNRPKTSPTVLERYGGGLCLQRALREDLVNVHQITYADDGIYVCNTGNNEVRYEAIADAADVKVYKLPPEQPNRLINSVFVTDEHVYIVLRHASEVASEVNRVSKATDEIETWFTDHRGIHNIYVDDEYYYYNASDDGRIVRCPLGTRDFEDLVVGGHPKGMEVRDGHMYVGVSEHAVEHARRFTADGKLAVVDLADWKVVEMYNLRLDETRPVGNINEVRFLGVEV